jgi:predicted  nucleic acid-binding Zn-ribbon protein
VVSSADIDDEDDADDGPSLEYRPAGAEGRPEAYDAKAGPVADLDEEIARLNGEIVLQRKEHDDAEREYGRVIAAMETKPMKSAAELDALATKRDRLEARMAKAMENIAEYEGMIAELRERDGSGATGAS